MKKFYDIVGLGVCILDIITVVDEFPCFEGVQKAHTSILQGGGPVATAMVAASRLGANVSMVDSLGDDWRSRLIIDELISYGVDTDHINIVSGATASIASIHVRKRDGKRAIVYSPGSAIDLVKPETRIQLVNKAKIVHVNGRHLEACMNMCEHANTNGVKVAFDGGAGRYREELNKVLRHVDYCIVSLDFARAWLGSSDIIFLLESMVKAGSELAVITDGANGSYVMTGDMYFHQQAFAVDSIVDTTGCGDIYHGAFLYGVSKGFDLRSTAKIASAAAAINAGALGGRGRVPKMEEIRQYIAGHGESIGYATS